MWFNILMVIFSGILAGSTAFYVFMTRKLWLATKDTAERTRDAFRLSLALQLYQAIGFILGKGKRRDKAFFNALRSTFPSEYNYLTSMFLPLTPDIKRNNWEKWDFSHDEELPKPVSWNHDNTGALTIKTIYGLNYEAGNYAAFSYECPKDKEIAWVEFDLHLLYAHESFKASLEYEYPEDPGRWHETWKWDRTEERDTHERIDFDDGAVKLRFALRCTRQRVGQDRWHVRVYKIVICLLPKIQK